MSFILNWYALLVVIMKKLFVISVTSLLLLCKPAFAQEAETSPTLLDGFSVGGYASASLTVPRNSSVEAAIDDISLIVRWESDSRFKFFGELELERPIAWNDDKRFNSKDTYFDLERLYIDYNLSEKLNLRAGRFLTLLDGGTCCMPHRWYGQVHAR